MRCACGDHHELLDPVFVRPDAIVTLPPDERARRARESDDLCALRGDDGFVRCFVRCLLPVALIDAPGTIAWGVWAEVDKDVLAIIRDRWSDPEQARQPPLEARLANRIPGAPDTIGLPLALQLTGPASRPRVTFRGESVHPFIRECRDGVTVHRAHEWLSSRPPAHAEHLRAYVCSHVRDDTHPILLVVHDADGGWSFMCGGEEGHDEVYVIGRNHLVARDPTLRQVLDLAAGEEAERRGVGSRWVRAPVPEEE
jgi:hypothetical protein